MDLTLPINIANGYHSGSQQIRVITEHWVNSTMFCPNCGSSLISFGNNRPVADFYCSKCSEEFELKSKQGKMVSKVVDGAYTTMIQRLRAENNPNFFFLTYQRMTHTVNSFLAIPKYFFVPSIIEKRNALGVNARRAGWIGCNIVISNIPEFGKVYYVQNGILNSKSEILEKWSRTDFVRHAHNIDAKGWLLDVLMCVEKLKKTEFSLKDVYGFEPYLKAKHPLNNNVQAKIRQQLQLLRDKHVIEFAGAGKYVMRA